MYIYILDYIFSATVSSNYIADIIRGSFRTLSDINGEALEKMVNILKVLTIFTEALP